MHLNKSYQCFCKAHIIPHKWTLGGRIWRQSYPSSCLQENDCSQNSNPYLTITSPRLLSLDQTMAPQKVPLAVNKKSNI